MNQLDPPHDAGVSIWLDTLSRELLETGTLRAFADHGDATHGLSDTTAAGAETLERAEQAGLDLAAITSELAREGVRSFCGPCHELLNCIETKLRRAAPATSARS